MKQFYQPWTTKDIEYLEKHYSHMTAAAIAEVLNRKPGDIYIELHKLHLRKHPIRHKPIKPIIPEVIKPVLPDITPDLVKQIELKKRQVGTYSKPCNGG